MDDIQETDLLVAGFEPEKKSIWLNGGKDRDEANTGRYFLKGYDPAPYVEFSALGSYARIEAMQWPIKTTADLQKFVSKTVLIFCDLK